ncbi:MAG: tRNA uridine-5-carboxymethylaminomethyl(34) synthesis enzyme MnmG [Erysipelotrichaceae bacterium]|nr:tRNA uridine-5-carboxymethylaminomethyl(34) synthesis enzyme MnmG [Erysipelotrichaceae bacterium]
MKNYEVIVVGGGHAGIEAALICAKQNIKTALISLSIENIAKMPCNPSIGGPAKGVVVREIDVLGGQMGITADKTALQFKILNTNKGPGVRALRVQSDKIAYQKYMQKVLLNQENLTVMENMVTELIIEDNIIQGVIFDDGTKLYSKIVILTTGTYMNAVNMISDEVTVGGPDLEPTTNKLSKSLEEAGLTLFRLKTGTPPRILRDSIDFSKTEYQPGSKEFVAFSYKTKEIIPFEKQVPCYLVHTNEETHKLIFANLDKSSMYSGVVKGVGPRYCPSIEDKLVRFKDKPRHQLFLEPESLKMDTIYLQGFSSSLPRDVQEKMVKTLPGFENAIIKKFAYAIEYDAIDPLQTKPTLENKLIENLFTAGQINGTSGYEEAAAQGLIAGINSINKLKGRPDFILKRDEAYIGVMIDDLVTKGTQEPYRLLTSRAEFRLLLRHDNADQRLMDKAKEFELISDDIYNEYQTKLKKIEEGKNLLKETIFSINSSVNELLISLDYEKLHDGISALELLKRPKVNCLNLQPYLPKTIEEEIGKQIDIEVKYEGYIVKAKKEANKLLAMDNVKLPKEIDYNSIANLSLEGRQKLSKIRPITIGQASRISGVDPSDVAILAMVLKAKG